MVLIFRLWKWLITVCVSWCHSDWAMWPRWPFTHCSMRTYWQWKKSCAASPCPPCWWVQQEYLWELCQRSVSPGMQCLWPDFPAQSAGRRQLCIRVWRGGKRGQMWCSCGRVLAFKGLDVSQWRKPERNTWHKYNVNPDTNLMPLILWVLPCFVTIVLLQSWSPACFRWKLVWFGSSFVTVFS